MAGNGEGTLLANRYRIVKQLGQGGMGSVWLVEDTQLDNKLFAIKMLPAVLVSNKRAYRQLKDEALVAMKLTHPNIVTLRAFEENNGNPFLVMDYIDGQTLDDYLADHALSLGKAAQVGEAASRRFNSAQVGEAASRRFESESDVLRILRPIAAALDYAHSKGVVHRDVKPGNVMIAKDGTPYILDFGIAREIQETMTRVTGKLSSGTLLYMSPEQLMGESPKPAQDVYSFAAMAYECLKGEPPFVRGAIEDQIKNKQPAPLPTELLTGNAAILAAGVMAGLAKKPEARPATCTAVLDGSVFSRKERKDAGAVALVATETGGPRPVAALKVFLAVAALALAAIGGWLWLSGQEKANKPSETTSTTVMTVTNVPPVSEVQPVSEVPPSAIPKGVPHRRNGAKNITLPAVTNDTNIAENRRKADEERKKTELKAKEAATAISIEATVRRGKIDRNVSDEDGFKKKKDDLEDLFVRAGALLDAKKWNEAAQQFVNYTNECDVLEKLDGERNRAVAARANANVAQGKAEEAEAEKYANGRWTPAVGLMKSASSQFAASQFGVAVGSFSLAAEQFDKCVEEATAEHKRQEEAEKEAAAEHKRQEEEAKKKAEEEARARESERRAKWRKEGEEFTINDSYGLYMTMKWCPKGTFTMGSPSNESGRFDNERQHQVTLTKGFWMGETEVTQGQWKQLMAGETVVDLARKALQDDREYMIADKKQTFREYLRKSKFDDPQEICGDVSDDVPVYYVSWEDAVRFCRKLTAKESAEGRIPDGYEYRLPTEAEWEYACRARTTSALPNGRNIRILGKCNAPALDDIAWYGGNSSRGFDGRGWDTSNWPEKQYSGGSAAPREVKGKQPNNWGLYDMIGNVWEWCGDWYGEYSYGSAADPTGVERGAYRVYRGGSWNNHARSCRSADRDGCEPSYRSLSLGFRVVLAPTH